MELVFSNALAFNEEHSPVWEDAIELRVSSAFWWCLGLNLTILIGLLP